MKIHFIFLLSLLAAAITLLYASRILRPWGHYLEKEHGIKMQMGDLYSRWLGTRELLLDGKNPYGPEVSHEIQTAFYGHPIEQSYADPHKHLVDEQRFAYPVYVVFLFAPTVRLDFAQVKRWARLPLAILVALNVYFCLSLLRWKLSWLLVAAIVLFALSSPQIEQGWRIEQLAILVGCLLSAGAWCISRNHLIGAGPLLAFSTIKPQMAVLPLCWFALWTLGNWRRRWPLAAAFAGSLSILTLAGEFVLPGWIGYFVAGLAAYRKYFPTSSLLQTVLGQTAGQVLGVAAVMGVLAFAWRDRKAEADSQSFINMLVVFLVADLVIFPLFTPFNQVLLLLPTLLLFKNWVSLPIASRAIMIVTLAWPAIVSAVMLVFPPALDAPGYMPLLPAVLGPVFPLLLSLLLVSRRERGRPAQLSQAGPLSSVNAV